MIEVLSIMLVRSFYGVVSLVTSQTPIGLLHSISIHIEDCQLVLEGVILVSLINSGWIFSGVLISS